MELKQRHLAHPNASHASAWFGKEIAATDRQVGQTVNVPMNASITKLVMLGATVIIAVFLSVVSLFPGITVTDLDSAMKP